MLFAVRRAGHTRGVRDALERREQMRDGIDRDTSVVGPVARLLEVRGRIGQREHHSTITPDPGLEPGGPGLTRGTGGVVAVDEDLAELHTERGREGNSGARKRFDRGIASRLAASSSRAVSPLSNTPARTGPR
jgi:hypothetical protein